MTNITKRKHSTAGNEPYPFNSNITVYYEMKHGKDHVVVGTPLRFKFQRGVYKFIKIVHNSDKNVTWIDCMDQANGTFRSFYVDQLKSVVKPKRTRKKNVGT